MLFRSVYEQADSLRPVSERLKIEIKTAQNLSRKPAEGTTGPLANAKFLTALFGDDAIHKKRNTEAVETGPNQLVAGRIVQYAPARTRALEEVRTAVRDRLVAERSAELARQAGQSRLTAWRAKPEDAAASALVLVSRDQPQGVAPKVLDAALRTDPSVLPSVAGVDLGDQGYAVVKVNRIVSRVAPDEAVAKQGRTQYAQAWAAAENQAYYGLLKERFKARISAPKVLATPGDLSTAAAQ